MKIWQKSLLIIISARHSMFAFVPNPGQIKKAGLVSGLLPKQKHDSSGSFAAVNAAVVCFKLMLLMGGLLLQCEILVIAAAAAAGAVTGAGACHLLPI